MTNLAAKLKFIFHANTCKGITDAYQIWVPATPVQRRMPFQRRILSSLYEEKFELFPLHKYPAAHLLCIVIYIYHFICIYQSINKGCISYFKIVTEIPKDHAQSVYSYFSLLHLFLHSSSLSRSCPVLYSWVSPAIALGISEENLTLSFLQAHFRAAGGSHKAFPFQVTKTQFPPASPHTACAPVL